MCMGIIKVTFVLRWPKGRCYCNQLNRRELLQTSKLPINGLDDGCCLFISKGSHVFTYLLTY